MYAQVEPCNYGPYMKHIWKEKIPPKIRFFKWSLENIILLTKDNLSKKVGGSLWACLVQLFSYQLF
jgi:hypothetical protein